tara:strand:+ start:508 stop:762 length:255 start_codon:yes stop_codon:yes gene_type:complete
MKGVGGGNTPNNLMDLLNFLFLNFYIRIRDLCFAVLGFCFFIILGSFFGSVAIISGLFYILFGDIKYDNNKNLSWNTFRHDHIC